MAYPLGTSLAAQGVRFVPVQSSFPALLDTLFRPTPPLGVPDETVALQDIFNKNWHADSYQTDDGPVVFGTQFDSEGDAYLSVLAPHAMVATFYKYEGGMRGSWEAGGTLYDLSLDVSIFRSRTNNYVVVRRRSDGRVVFKRRIREILLKTFPLGKPVNIDGREYRVFFGNGVIPGNPARTDTNSLSLCLVTNIGDGDSPDFQNYMIPFRDLEGGAVVSYRLYDGVRVRLRVSPDRAELEIHLP